MELEEDDTIFKCVSVLQARAPPPSSSSAGPGGGNSGSGSSLMTSARGHSFREGLMGLKR